MKRIKNLLSVLLMALIALSANAQKEVKVTSDVPYCTDSPSQVLDIAEPVNFGSEGLRPAIVFLALALWGYVLGFIGLIIALPLTSLLISYYNEFILHVPKIPSGKRKSKIDETKMDAVIEEKVKQHLEEHMDEFLEEHLDDIKQSKNK